MRNLDIINNGVKMSIIILDKKEEINGMESDRRETYISNLEKYCASNLNGFGPIWMSYQDAINTLKDRAFSGKVI